MRTAVRLRLGRLAPSTLSAPLPERRRPGMRSLGSRADAAFAIAGGWQHRRQISAALHCCSRALPGGADRPGSEGLTAPHLVALAAVYPVADGWSRRLPATRTCGRGGHYWYIPEGRAVRRSDHLALPGKHRSCAPIDGGLSAADGSRSVFTGAARKPGGRPVTHNRHRVGGTWRTSAIRALQVERRGCSWLTTGRFGRIDGHRQHDVPHLAGAVPLTWRA